MKMIKKIYNKVFAPPTSVELAIIELEKAKKAFLEAKTHTEYYACQTEFESIRIKRLEEYVDIVVEAGELASNPLRQQVTSTIITPVNTVAPVKPATRKTAALTKPAARKKVTPVKPATRKTVK